MSEETEIKIPEVETSKRLKDSDWIVIVSLWERGEVTLADLSDKFGVTVAALSQGLRRRGAVRGKNAHASIKKVQEKIDQEKDKLIEDIYNFKKRFLKYGDVLMNLAMSEITEAKKASIPLSTRKGNLEAIASATKVFKAIRHDMYHLYDLYDDNKTENDNFNFNVGVYTEDDIEALREAQKYLDFSTEEKEEDKE